MAKIINKSCGFYQGVRDLNYEDSEASLEGRSDRPNRSVCRIARSDNNFKIVQSYECFQVIYDKGITNLPK